MARLLPEIFQATVGTSGPLDGFLAAQEQLQNPSETAIDEFAEQLNPRLSAPAFVYLLAYWTDLDYLLDGPPQAPHFAAGVGRMRELIATAARNGRERGTEKTLIRFLETATGCKGFRVETDLGGTYHIEIFAPKAARTFETLVRRVIVGEKPAFATFKLQFADSGSADNNGDSQDNA